MNKKTRSTKSEKWRHTCNSVEIAWTNEQKVAVTSYGRNKNHDDEIKNIAGQVLTYNSKNFHWLNRKTRPRMDYEWIEKTIIKKFRSKNKKKKTENQCQIAVCEQKTTTEKSNFCSNTIFSLYFKIRAKKNSRRKTTRFFAPFLVSAWPKSPLQFDFKNHENVWTDLKKKTSPQYNSNSLNCKKPREGQ